MFKVTFEGKLNREIDLEHELSLLAAADKGGAALPHRCDGHARCGSCLVTIEQGKDQLSPMGTVETRMLKGLKAESGQRLACQARANGDVCCRVD